MKFKVRKIKGSIIGGLLFGMFCSGAFADGNPNCSAPCTDTTDLSSTCTIVTQKTGPIHVDYAEVQFAKVYDVCNTGKICPVPDEGQKVPSTPIKFTFTKQSTKKYSIGGGYSASGGWGTFNLTAGADGTDATTEELQINTTVDGFCVCGSMDIAKSHSKDTVYVTQTVNSAFWCYPTGDASWTETLDTFGLAPRAPAMPHNSPPQPCLTVCP